MQYLHGLAFDLPFFEVNVTPTRMQVVSGWDELPGV